MTQLPMVDPHENAAIVNALQRHAAVVVQKSLREGFGLTVTEAMWKARPVVASVVGGIVDQVADGREGVLLHDPADPTAFAAALGRLLAARQRVRRDLLGVRQLADDADRGSPQPRRRSVAVAPLRVRGPRASISVRPRASASTWSQSVYSQS
jgi:trehalose synthase